MSNESAIIIRPTSNPIADAIAAAKAEAADKKMRPRTTESGGQKERGLSAVASDGFDGTKPDRSTAQAKATRPTAQAIEDRAKQLNDANMKKVKDHGVKLLGGATLGILAAAVGSVPAAILFFLYAVEKVVDMATERWGNPPDLSTATRRRSHHTNQAVRRGAEAVVALSVGIACFATGLGAFFGLIALVACADRVDAFVRERRCILNAENPDFSVQSGRDWLWEKTKGGLQRIEKWAQIRTRVEKEQG